MSCRGRTHLSRATTWFALLLLFWPVASLSDAGRQNKKKSARDTLVKQIWYDIAVHNDKLYTAGTRQLRIDDPQDVLAFKPVEQLDFRETLLRIQFDEERMYLASGRHGLLLFEPAAKDSWTFHTRIDTTGNVLDFAVRGDVVFLADGLGGLRVIDISDAERPRRIRHFPTRSIVRGLALQEDRLATAEGSAGIRVFSLRYDSRPELLASLADMGSANDLSWAGETLLVAAGRRGVLLFQREGHRLVELARISGKGSAKHIVSSPPYAFVSYGSEGVRIFDIHDPGAPREVARLDLPRSFEAGRMVREGDRLYVAMGIGGVGIFDVSEPSLPRLLRPRERALRINGNQD